MERPLAEMPVVVLDTETTGLYPGLGARVVEIAAVRFEPRAELAWQESGRFNRLLNPGRPIEPDASRVSGLHDWDVAGVPPFMELAGELLQLLAGAVIVAHNARFDAEFLGLELYLASRAQPERFAPVLRNPWLCTLQLARRHFYFGSNSLGHIARNLGVRMGRAHRALGDVYMTTEVLKRMARELAKRRIESAADLLAAQGGPIYTPPPPRLELPPLLAEALASGRPVRLRYLDGWRQVISEVRLLYPAEHQGTAYLIASQGGDPWPMAVPLAAIMDAELI